MPDPEKKKGNVQPGFDAVFDSRMLFQQAFQTTPDAFNISRFSDGLILEVNQGFEKLTGYSGNETIGRTSTEINLWEDPEDRKKLVDQLVKKGRCERLIARFRIKDGKIRTGIMSAATFNLNHEKYILSITRDITEEEKMYEALRASENEYRASLDSLDDSVFLVDTDKTIVLTNRFLEERMKALGLDHNITGKKVREAFPFLTDKMISRYDKIFRQGESFHTGEHFKIGDRSYFSENKLIPVFQKNKVEKILTIIRDVTSNRRSELVRQTLFSIANAVNVTKDLHELLRVIRKELSQMFDTSNFFVALYDRESDTFSLPYIVDEKDDFNVFPAGKTLTGYVVRNDKPLLVTNENIQELVKTGEVENIGTPSKIWLGVPLKSSGEIIGAIVLQSYEDENAYSFNDFEILQFVSNQIGLSIQSIRAFEQLTLEKAYFEQWFQSAPETIILTDNDGHLLRVNKEFARMFGYRPGEVIGKKIDDLIVSPEYMEEAQTYTRQLAVGKTFKTETIRKNKNGKLIHVSLLGTPIYIGKGQVAVIVIYRDIAEQKIAEQNLKAAKEKAEESDRLKSAFLANMSHEIRTPMNAILGFAELLRDNAISPQEKKEYLDIIRDKGKELMVIISDIIDISKIETGILTVQKSTFAVNDLLRETFRHFREEFSLKPEKKLELKLKIPDHENPLLKSDKQKLKQVFSNLLHNAYKFTDKGTIEIGYFREDQKIVFTVKDTGIGIVREDQKIIFERFRQVHQNADREYGGTGLGLAICKNIIEILGGEIWVKSHPGKGSIFSFSLPVNK